MTQRKMEIDAAKNDFVIFVTLFPCCLLADYRHLKQINDAIKIENLGKVGLG